MAYDYINTRKIREGIEEAIKFYLDIAEEIDKDENFQSNCDCGFDRHVFSGIKFLIDIGNSFEIDNLPRYQKEFEEAKKKYARLILEKSVDKIIPLKQKP